MKILALDSVILFALIIPFIMGYRIGPGETPFWLFGIIFLGMLLYILLDLVKLKDHMYFLYKKIGLWFVIIAVIGSAFSASIIVRHQTSPIYSIHDIVLQQEAAIRFFLDGKNPYATNYFGTPLEEWHYSDKEINPALYHFVMEPFYLLFALPFYFISNHTIGYFDGRIPLLFLFFSLLVLASLLVKEEGRKRLFLVLLAFNPSVLPYTLEGRSDLFMYPFLFLGFFLLYKRRYSWAGIPIALAFAVKQSAWLLFPFYVAYLFFTTKSIKKTIFSLLPFIVVFGVIVVPFFLWDQNAFLDSTVRYLSGDTKHSYPISGYGLGRLLHEVGVIKDLKEHYPFVIWQAVVGLPLLVGLIYYLKKLPSISRLILVYVIFLFVYWYLSRYFNNSHLSYISLVFITAYLWPGDEEKKAEKGT